jgi:cytoskeleton protein RodZ
MREVFQPGYGASLKAAREARKLEVADVAAKLKLTARQVEALEEENFEHLPSEVFVRGFVRNYARLVGIEPDSLIAPVDVGAGVAEVITAPSAGVDVGSGNLRRWLVYPMIAAAVFLILVAALYHWLRQGEEALLPAQPETVSQAEEVVPAPAQPAAAQAAPASDAVVTPALPSQTDAGSASTAVVTEAPPIAPVEAALQPIRPAPPVVDANAVNADINVNTGARSMRFEPAQDAWIQVVDGKGNRFSKLVRAGTAESFSGEPPFRLVVGEAALVRLTYNGHSIDLTPFIGQKVARLTLE